MTKEDAEKLHKDLSKDADTFFVLEDSKEHVTSIPPTKLKNIPLLRPFEMFVKMYGLPAYNEFDPTLLIAVTYSIFFGFMFGDAGQGLLLLIGGFLLYKFKKINLAAIISCCGFFSTIFGFLFGSCIRIRGRDPRSVAAPDGSHDGSPVCGPFKYRVCRCHRPRHGGHPLHDDPQHGNIL